MHRRGAHRSRDHGQILQSREALVQRPFDQPVPALACTRLDHPSLGVFVQQLLTHDLDLEHQRPDVPRQDDVAAAAKHKFRNRRQFGVANERQQVTLAAHPNQRVRLGNDVKCVAGLQWDIFLD